MYIVYVNIDKEGEVCKPYTGREYHSKEEAYKELREALIDPDYPAAWIEEV